LTTPIRLIAIIRTSRPDKAGNTQTVAEYYAPDKGRHRSVTVACHSPGNARFLGYTAIGKDWEPLLVTEAAGLPVGVVAAWSKGAMREGSPAAEAALRALLSEEAEVAPPEVEKVTINDKDRLYVIKCGKGYSTMGWDYCAQKARALALELGAPDTTALPGSLAMYQYWKTACARGQERNAATGWRSAADLTPSLIGLEGKRVEVVDEWGATKRFLVGKSTGWMPCHLAIARRGCSGGPAVSIGTPRSVRVVG
jgi:hypothetical protein